MKTQIITITALLCIASASFAKIWTVGPSTLGGVNFTTIQAAHDAATAGDTVQVLPSGTSYGDINCSKKLIFYGPGFFLGENFINTPNVATAKLGDVNFNSGSEGSVISGIHIETKISIGTSNISILRNYFSYLDAFNSPNSINFFINGSTIPINNLIIKGNFRIAINYEGNSNYPITNLIITNNYISDFWSTSTWSGAVIENNIFDVYRLYIYNSTVKNNIFSSYSSTILPSNSTLSNNIDIGTFVPTGNNNLQNVDYSTIFTGLPNNSTDGQWQLKSSSPAKGAGQGGVDCGIFGGSTPYVLSGIPTVPSITTFTVPIQSNGNTLNIVVGAKSNP